MTLLSGWGPIALAAGLTIPPLVALYFLKLRRQPMPVSSTLLWKRAVEDLQVNAPFQRIRNNLLLWLQLLILAIAAFCLGKPMIDAEQRRQDTLILLIDQSASMNVTEPDGRSRLEIAREQARTEIDNMADGARAMIVGFSDRATIVSAFDTDKDALKRKLDEIEPTEATTSLSEAISLAEAYMQNLVIAGDAPGTDIAVQSTAPPARAVIITDGNVADAQRLTVKRLPTEDMQVVSVGERADNVAILSMDAKRNYERPAFLEVFALVRNFGDAPVTLDANLFINDQHVDVQSMVLAPGHTADADAGTSGVEAVEPDEARPTAAIASVGPPPGSVASVAFDEVEYEGGGVVEVRLRVDDALTADNAAYTIVQPPRNVSVLLVTAGDVFLRRALDALPIDLEEMSPAAYEAAGEDELTLAGRSKWDVVVFDNHSTGRLPPGAYLFFAGVPAIDGVAADGVVENEILFNWDEAHPILRYVAVDTVQVYQWLALAVPPEAERLIEGETSPVLAYLTREGRQYLICAFSVLMEDPVTGRPMMNTDWVFKPHFPVFLSNALQYLAGSLSPTGLRNVRPGEPIEFPVLEGTDEITVRRPDGESDRVPTAGFTTVNYARTRRVGVYNARPGIEGEDTYAVNLFSAAESDVKPRSALTLAGTKLTATEEVQRVNKPLWPWLLLAVLAVLAIEWAVYSKRVYV